MRFTKVMVRELLHKATSTTVKLPELVHHSEVHGGKSHKGVSPKARPQLGQSSSTTVKVKLPDLVHNDLDAMIDIGCK